MYLRDGGVTPFCGTAPDPGVEVGVIAGPEGRAVERTLSVVSGADGTAGGRLSYALGDGDAGGTTGGSAGLLSHWVATDPGVTGFGTWCGIDLSVS